MTVPEALFTITLQRIEGIPATSLGERYAVARIGGRFFGRSRAIPNGADTLDLTAEPVPWTHTVRAPETPPTIVVEVWDDRGDTAPYPLVSLTITIPPSFVGGDVTYGTTQRCAMHVDVRRVPRIVPAVVPRVPNGQTGQATVVIPNTLVVEIANIRGLYKPGHVPTGATNPRRAEPLQGYKSEDHRGRIYLNRDIDRDYESDKQLIEIHARVTVLRGQLPAGAKLQWTVLDPDDPSDGQPTVHRQWTSYLDPGDYDATTGAPTGMHDNDNEGSPDESPRWEAVTGFALDVVSDTEAKTDIASGESKVTIHCPNVAGDNLIVRASIDSPTPVEVFEDQTGVMSLWHAIDVEYMRMATAFALPVSRIPDFFEQAFVQLDVTPENSGVPDTEFIGSSQSTFRQDCHTYIDTNASHAREPGWFQILSAREAHPPAGPSRTATTLYNGAARLRDASTAGPQGFSHEYITIRGHHPDAFVVRISWASRTLVFLLTGKVTMNLATGPHTRLWLEPHDLTFGFTAGDGSEDHLYATQKYYGPRFHHNGSSWVPGGYGVPEHVHVEVRSPASGITSGISPLFPATGSSRHFAGRTVIFTRHPSFVDSTGNPVAGFDDQIVPTLAHELVHAFGMPHKCGLWDHRTPRTHACHMNYSWVGLVDPTDSTRALEVAPIGGNLCGRHLKEVRRVHLEDNGLLSTWGW